MDPLTIMGIIAAALPLLQQFLAMGVEIEKAVEAAQGTKAAPMIAQVQAQHAALAKTAIAAATSAVVPK